MRRVAIARISVPFVIVSCGAISPMTYGAIITPSVQTRSVSAGASGSVTAPVGQTISASGFVPFDAVASAVTPANGNGQVSLSASQHSRINSDSIVINGEFRYTTGPNGSNDITNQRSLLDVTFSVDQTTPYSMAVSLTDGQLAPQSRLGLELFAAGGQEPFVVLQYSTNSSQLGQLSPGSYRLLTTIDSFNQPSNFGFAAFFAIPSPSVAPVLAMGALIASRRRRS